MQSVMRCIDLNCDLGEEAAHDAELMPLVTSANIACGDTREARTPCGQPLNWPCGTAWRSARIPVG